MTGDKSCVDHADTSQLRALHPFLRGAASFCEARPSLLDGLPEAERGDSAPRAQRSAA